MTTTALTPKATTADTLLTPEAQEAAEELAKIAAQDKATTKRPAAKATTKLAAKAPAVKPLDVV
ncbi:hypothetical protein [Arthrobacter sp. KK5.5]|uniref:hypothetical protein n=1 Tax=Arthrobacter sp. KK5.5 TaxID=3373084 RepID=UPI003EE4374B